MGAPRVGLRPFAIESGPLQAVAAPLTPRPRGTNYEDMPSISNAFEKAPDGVHIQIGAGCR